MLYEVITLHAAARDNGRPGIGIMVAALILVDPRRAAEFAHPDDGGRFQQAAPNSAAMASLAAALRSKRAVK